MPTLAELINQNQFATGLQRPSGNPIGKWVQGVAGRTMNPLSALAGEAQRYMQMQPEELSGQFGASGGSLAGLAGIVNPSTALGLKTIKNIPQSDIFKQAVENTPSAKLTDEGLLMRIQRNQVAEQLGEPSVRGGVFYLPEGAAQAKYYSTGRGGYGGAEKVAGETLVQNPLFVKGATGGKAPESAYDTLLGKGSYANMRTDALKTISGWNTPYSEKISRVEDFLSKYAPELQDQAEYIVMNSKSGNQLPYALQEAAVASKVRNSGYDAVLGYSSGKKGTFFSELFDVREKTYPASTGETEIWEQLTK